MRQQRHARSGAHAETGQSAVGIPGRHGTDWSSSSMAGCSTAEHPSIGPRRVAAEGWAQARKRHEAEVKEMAKLYNKSDLPDELPQGTPQPRHRACRSARGLLRGLRCTCARPRARACVRACVGACVWSGPSACLPVYYLCVSHKR